ncbi:putative esterase C31F10.02, partial [Fusarium oxysporum f. sp. albedinis]
MWILLFPSIAIYDEWGKSVCDVTWQKRRKPNFKVYPKPFLATMSSQRTPRFTMQTRNTVRVPSSRRSAQSRTGSPDHQTNQLSNDDSTPTVFEKNTLFLPKELKLIGPSNWEQFSPAQKAILRINGLEDAVF